MSINQGINQSMFNIINNIANNVRKMYDYLQIYKEKESIILNNIPSHILNMIDPFSEVKFVGEYNILERVLIVERDYVSTIPSKLIGENTPQPNYCLYNSIAWVQDSSREDLPYPNHSTIERFLTFVAWNDKEFNNKIGQITLMALYKNDSGSEIISNTVQQYNVLGTDGLFKDYLINNFILDFSSYPYRQLHFIGPKK